LLRFTEEMIPEHFKKARLAVLAHQSVAQKREPRITFDDPAHVITVDQQAYGPIDPTAYLLFKTIYGQGEETRQPVSSACLKRQPGLEKKTISREFEKLPQGLKDLGSGG
jgi:hypothetical protein